MGQRIQVQDMSGDEEEKEGLGIRHTGIYADREINQD